MNRIVLLKYHLVFWSIVLLGFQAHGQVHTVSNYTELKTYQGEIDSVYVDHERYYGLFVKGTCSITNYGTTFLTEDTCWQRVHNNYLPRYWGIGEVSPVDGKLIFKEADAINGAVYAAWQAGGDTVEIDKLYEIDRSIMLLENITYLGTTDSAGFKRENSPKTILTDTAYVGDKWIQVESNAGFRSFQKINIASDFRYDSLASFTGYTAGVSASFGGDKTIFLSGGSMARQMLPGDSVGLFFPLMKWVSWTSSNNVTIKNMVFDGNRSSYGLSHDWRVSTTIQFSTNSGSLIDHCRFYNIPSENIFLCGTDVQNSSGIGFNGSALHFSCTNDGGPTNVLYNDFRNLNEVGNEVMVHSEAAFTFSAKVRNFRISYNTLNKLEEQGIGIISNDDTSNIITDNLLDTEQEEVGFRPFYKFEDTNFIYNNKNLNTADLSTGQCLVSNVQPIGTLPCAANSTLEKPLQMGQLINISLDSLVAINSNENYIKGIAPIYSNEFFDLVGISVYSPALSKYHKWTFTEKEGFTGIIFDNGHKNGIAGEGNWGYELCDTPGGCNNIRIFFKVKKLPTITSAVPCPLEGLRVVYDGEMETWSQPVLCDNAPKYFEQSKLGRPVLLGSGACEAPNNLQSSQVDFTSVNLSWDETGEATAYLIWYKEVGADAWKKVVQRDGTGQKKLKRLKESADYTWRVQAKCGDLWSAPSEEKRFIMEAMTCTDVSFIDLSTGPIFHDRARLNWDQLSGMKFQIRWRKVGEPFWGGFHKRPSYRHWLKGLSPATAYEWQIRTVCEEGGTVSTSDWSDLQTMTTLESDEMNAGKSGIDLNGAEDFTLLPLVEQVSDLKIYPNPAQSEVQVSSASLSMQRIKIVNAAGRLMFEEKMAKNSRKSTYSLSLRGLPSGLYFVVVYSEQGTYWKKLLIE